MSAPPFQPFASRRALIATGSGELHHFAGATAIRTRLLRAGWSPSEIVALLTGHPKAKSIRVYPGGEELTISQEYGALTNAAEYLRVAKRELEKVNEGEFVLYFGNDGDYSALGMNGTPLSWEQYIGEVALPAGRSCELVLLLLELCRSMRALTALRREILVSGDLGAMGRLMPLVFTALAEVDEAEVAFEFGKDVLKKTVSEAVSRAKTTLTAEPEAAAKAAADALRTARKARAAREEEAKKAMKAVEAADAPEAAEAGEAADMLRPAARASAAQTALAEAQAKEARAERDAIAAKERWMAAEAKWRGVESVSSWTTKQMLLRPAAQLRESLSAVGKAVQVLARAAPSRSGGATNSGKRAVAAAIAECANESFGERFVEETLGVSAESVLEWVAKVGNEAKRTAYDLILEESAKGVLEIAAVRDAPSPSDEEIRDAILLVTPAVWRMTGLFFPIAASFPARLESGLPARDICAVLLPFLSPNGTAPILSRLLSSTATAPTRPSLPVELCEMARAAELVVAARAAQTAESRRAVSAAVECATSDTGADNLIVGVSAPGGSQCFSTDLDQGAGIGVFARGVVELDVRADETHREFLLELLKRQRDLGELGGGGWVGRNAAERALPCHIIGMSGLPGANREFRDGKAVPLADESGLGVPFGAAELIQPAGAKEFNAWELLLCEAVASAGVDISRADAWDELDAATQEEAEKIRGEALARVTDLGMTATNKDRALEALLLIAVSCVGDEVRKYALFEAINELAGVG